MNRAQVMSWNSPYTHSQPPFDWLPPTPAGYTHTPLHHSGYASTGPSTFPSLHLSSHTAYLPLHSSTHPTYYTPAFTDPPRSLQHPPRVRSYPPPNYSHPPLSYPATFTYPPYPLQNPPPIGPYPPSDYYHASAGPHPPSCLYTVRHPPNLFTSQYATYLPLKHLYLSSGPQSGPQSAPHPSSPPAKLSLTRNLPSKEHFFV